MVVVERRCSTLLTTFTLVYCNALELHVYEYTTLVPHTMLEHREALFPSHSEDWTQFCCRTDQLFRALILTTVFLKKRNFSEPIFPGDPGSNGSESNLQKTPLRYSSQVSRNPNLFEYMSFWAHDKTAQIPLQSIRTWYFFSKWCISFGQECMILNHWVFFLNLQCSR